jgi:UPF0176 protein
MDNIIVSAFYHFTNFSDPEKIKIPLETLCKKNKIKGSILLATEGINGTISGKTSNIDIIIQHIKSLPGCRSLETKTSTNSSKPFNRMKVRIKKEIVTMGQPNIDPRKVVGSYIKPEDWNTFAEKDDVVVIDTRNNYEIQIGTFKNSISPNTDSFRQFPEWWRKNKDKYQGKKIAMFCTGGIRCEKSSNYLINQGVKDVFHLKGGILKYLEKIKQEDSNWVGECYVFDHRVSVTHGLNKGSYNCCFACGRPISLEDENSSNFEFGVSCKNCINEFSEDRKLRFRERQKQILLATKRGKSHLG